MSTAPLSSPQFSFWQRVQLSLITWVGFLVIQLIGPTLRVAVSYEDGAPASLDTRPMILSFWHSCIFPATYVWRNLQIRVMSSDSFDGEYTGRIIRKFGFVKVRGSSSRGAVRALLGMKKAVEEGGTAAFTIDGPKGPRFVAKPGPVLVAKATGAPMVAFHIALENPWVLNTWDRSMIPRPFSKALMRVSRGIQVPEDIQDSDRDAYHAKLQQALDRVRDFSEAHVHEAGGKEFPYCDARA
ncbi:MAG TPA: lysophospholipid acyltransferase family protein [Terriglobales bacterium]|nr:lysophospholipid acyltransferase family protein [Terriglobales bacterium]